MEKSKYKFWKSSLALPIEHESDPHYKDLVPFSPVGLERWTEEVANSEEADLIWMGQVHDRNSHILDFPWEFPGKGIWCVDVEGDWPGKDVPQWVLNKCAASIVMLPRQRPACVMVRPTYSYLLAWLAKNFKDSDVTMPDQCDFYFAGQADPAGLRARLAAGFINAGSPGEFRVNPVWNGPTEVYQPIVQSYLLGMQQHTFVLCPGGIGKATARFYEACLLGRIPVVMANAYVMGELEGYDMSFVIRIPEEANPDQIARVIRQYMEKDVNATLRLRCAAARMYWNNVVAPYFADPTKYFIEWVETGKGWGW